VAGRGGGGGVGGSFLGGDEAWSRFGQVHRGRYGLGEKKDTPDRGGRRFTLPGGKPRTENREGRCPNEGKGVTGTPLAGEGDYTQDRGRGVIGGPRCTRVGSTS